MAKVEKKSIAELVAARTKRPTPEEIDNITQQIHTATTVPVVAVAPEVTPTPIVEIPLPSPPFVEEEVTLEQMVNTKRISVNASIDLYIKAKTRATRQGKTLMSYIITLMENDVKNMK